MDSAIVAGAFGVVGTALGWVLSEVGTGWRQRVERRRAERIEMDAGVFEAADAAGAIAEGVRWLVGVDASKARHGEGIDHQGYQAAVMELRHELRRLRRTPVVITAKGPAEALPLVTDVVHHAQTLWDAVEALPRREIAGQAPELRRACDELAEHARTLAATRGPGHWYHSGTIAPAPPRDT